MTLPTKPFVIAWVLCIVVIAATYAFLVPFGADFVWLSLGGMLVAESAFSGGMLFAGCAKRHACSVLSTAGISTTAVVCAAALFVASVLFGGALWAMVGAYLSIALIIRRRVKATDQAEKGFDEAIEKRRHLAWSRS